MKRILLALIVVGAFAGQSQACFLRMFTCGPQPVRVCQPHTTVYQAPQPQPQVTIVDGKLVLPSPESLGIDPRGNVQTVGYPYANNGPNGRWIVYPNQGNCPNGNCPR